MKHVLSVLSCAAAACGMNARHENPICDSCLQNPREICSALAYAPQPQALHHIRGDETAFIICSGRESFFQRSKRVQESTPLLCKSLFSACSTALATRHRCSPARRAAPHATAAIRIDLQVRAPRRVDVAARTDGVGGEQRPLPHAHDKLSGPRRADARPERVRALRAVRCRERVVVERYTEDFQ